MSIASYICFEAKYVGKGVGVSLSIFCLLFHFCHTYSINDIYITYVSKIEYFIDVFFVFAVITHKRVLLYSERR